jgi:hypothetical protein
VIRRLPHSLCPTGKNPLQDTWVKMEFIKNTREGKYKGEHGGCKWSLPVEKASFSFKVYLKLKLI